jgi:hypothetical protein
MAKKKAKKKAKKIATPERTRYEVTFWVEVEDSDSSDDVADRIETLVDDRVSGRGTDPTAAEGFEIYDAGDFCATFLERVNQG